MKTNTILIKEDKTLVGTQLRTIFEGENRADEIQFLFDQNFFDGIDDNYKALLQVILPYPDETAGTPTTGKMRYMEFDEELYKERYRTTLPINSILTKKAGNVVFWFMLWNLADPDHIRMIKTEPYTLVVNPNLQGTSSIIDEDESYDILTSIQEDINELKHVKIDKDFDYDEENQTIQFYVNGVPYGKPVQLDTEVSWRDWN